MPAYDDLLEVLSKPTRVAIAAACVEHVIELYKKANFNYKVAGASAVLGADADTDIVDAVLALAWRFAERGKAVDPRAVELFEQVTSKAAGGVERDDMSLPGLDVVEAAEHVLRAIHDDTEEAAANALDKCEDVLSDMIESLEDYDERAPDEACEQENAWQELVIDRAKTAKVPLGRALFADLIARKLPWQKLVP